MALTGFKSDDGQSITHSHRFSKRIGLMLNVHAVQYSTQHRTRQAQDGQVVRTFHGVTKPFFCSPAIHFCIHRIYQGGTTAYHHIASMKLHHASPSSPSLLFPHSMGLTGSSNVTCRHCNELTFLFFFRCKMAKIPLLLVSFYLDNCRGRINSAPCL